MKIIFLFPVCLLAAQILFAQSNIQQPTSINSDGAAPDASALLDVQATTKGMLVPRMTTGQRNIIASPAIGLLVFDITTGGFWFYNGTAWVDLSSAKTLADADGNTKIQVEESPNEDIIRFDLGGTESLVLRKNAGGSPRLVLPDALNNTFVGENTGNANTSGSNLTAIGFETLKYNTTGGFNTGLGAYSLFSNTTGMQNTALGNATLVSNTTGSQNTAAGTGALNANTTGFRNTAIGYFALHLNTTGFDNTATGYHALSSNTYGIENTATGWLALSSNTSGSNNTATGWSALYANTVGQENTAYGHSALSSNTTGDFNTAIGEGALDANITGSSNTAVGHDALRSNQNSSNTAVGSKSLYANTTGGNNTALGYVALSNNSSGLENTAVGYAALSANQTGNNNVAMGGRALSTNSAGSDNIALGFFALRENQGNNNTAVGESAMQYNNAGGNNTGIGVAALLNNYSGNWNTCIGDRADVSANNLNGASSLGTQAIANADNKIVLGANINGMVIGGYANWTNLSDGRFKEDIKEDVPGLSFISQLRPVTYWINTDKLQRHITALMPDSIAQRYLPDAEAMAKDREHTHTGFVAQEVEAAAKTIGYDFDGVNAPKNPTDNYSIAYSQFVPSLVKGMQEQQATIEGLQTKNAAQEIENAALITQLEIQSIQLQKITAALAGAGIAVEK